MNATANNTLRIIAEENHGHWSARFDDPRFPDSYGGSDAMGAIRRLIENSPHLGFVVSHRIRGRDRRNVPRLRGTGSTWG